MDSKSLPEPKAKPDKPHDEAAFIKRLKGDPDDLKSVHGTVMGASVYGDQIRRYVDQTILNRTTTEYVTVVLESMNVRDSFEQMLVVQAIWTHARLARLSIMANQQDGRDNLKVVNEACDHAANTFRRQMQALADYRQPRKSGDSFTAIKQANFAQQQVVQNAENGKLPEQKASNEQGSTDRQTAKALPAYAGGTGILTEVRPAREAVAALHRAEDSRG